MDKFVGMNMQKPMLSDPAGLTDTMWDLIVNAIYSLAVVIYGYWYMKRPERSTIEFLIILAVKRIAGPRSKLNGV